MCRDIASVTYWGLRSYLPDGVKLKAAEIGLEPTLGAHVEHMVAVFREVRRVLRDDGTCWLVLGDSYAGSWGAQSRPDGNIIGRTLQGGAMLSARQIQAHPRGRTHTGSMKHTPDLKPKDLRGIPWRVAFALQADGWYLRSAAPWVKRSAMPESVQDRPTSSLEYVFLLTKQPQYYFDMDAVRQRHRMRRQARPNGHKRWRPGPLLPAHTWPGTQRDAPGVDGHPAGRACRNSDWWFASVGMLLAADGEILGFDVPPQSWRGAHYAAFPATLVTPMVLAGTSAHGCCAQCGAPYTRLLERSGGRDWRQDTMVSNGIPGELDGPGGYKRGQSSTPLNNVQQVTTTAWRPGCTHNASVEPCVVFDPFGGTGTTALVARTHGRIGISMDLSWAYLHQAQGRLGDGPAPTMPTTEQLSFFPAQKAPP